MSQKSTSFKYDLHQSIKPKIAPLTIAVTGALAATSLQAATITVTSLSDDPADSGCELRSALAAASGNVEFGGCPSGDEGPDTIEFAAGLNGTIQLDGNNAIGGFEYGADDSSLAIGESVTIDGDNRITVRGSGGGSVFQTKYDTGTDGFLVDSLTLSDITITNGQDERGGGLYSRAQDLTLDNVTMSGNSAEIAGGAVFHIPHDPAASNDLSIDDSTISSNSVFGLNETSGGGGAIYANLKYDGFAFITNTTFEDNTSLSGNGGAVNLQSENQSSLGMKYNTFENNEAKYAGAGSGGGAFIDMPYLGAVIQENDFFGNEANGSGGGLYLTESFSSPGEQFASITITDNDFTGNRSQISGGGAFIDVENGDQGSIAEPTKFVDISGSTFTSNESDGNAAGLRLNLGDTVTSTISQSTLSLNTSQSGSGGGAFITAQDTQLYIYDTSVKYNDTVAGAGGGMQVSAPGSTFGMELTAFIGNEAQGGCGGGFRLSGDVEELGIGTSAFRNNTASACGGGLSLAVPGLQNSVAEFKYNEVSDNTAGSIGGGINANLGSGTQLFLKNSTISGNEALGGVGGGARLGGNMEVEVKYSTVANNTSDGEGGGIHSSAESCAISNTIMAGNTGNGTLYQDLRGTTLCDVSDSLIAGAKYSQFNNEGGNLLDVNPYLQPLADNGGPTLTHALLETSLAVDAGTAGKFAPDTDQRGDGFPRVSGGGLDMGAYELRIDTIFSDRFEQTPP